MINNSLHNQTDRFKKLLKYCAISLGIFAIASVIYLLNSDNSTTSFGNFLGSESTQTESEEVSGINLRLGESNKLEYRNEDNDEWIDFGELLSDSQSQDNLSKVKAGNGLLVEELADTTVISIDAATCSGTDKLQWDGATFICTSDVDTASQITIIEQILNNNNEETEDFIDTDTTYTAGNGLVLEDERFSIENSLEINGVEAPNDFTLIANRDRDDYFYFRTSSNNPGFFWEGVTTNNDPGIRINESTGKIEFRDEDESNWTELDSLYSSGSGTVTEINTGDGLTGGTITDSGTIGIDAAACSGTDKLQWTGNAFICSPDIDTDTNTDTTYLAGNDIDLDSNNNSFSIESTLDVVEQINAGNNLVITANSDLDDHIYFSTISNNPGIYWEGISSTNDPALRINELSGKLEYRDENESSWTEFDSLYGTTGTVTNIDTGNGLTGGAITTSGSISIDAAACSGTDKLQWTGTAFVCSPDVDTDTDTDTNTTYSAGSDLDLSGTVFSLEPTLDTVNRLNASGAIDLYPSGETDDYISIANAGTDQPAIFWEGVAGATASPSIRANHSTGKLEYRDADGSWTSFTDSLGSGGGGGGSSTSNIYSANGTVTDGSYLEVVHSQDTNDLIANGWVLNGNTGKYEITENTGNIASRDITIQNNTATDLTNYQVLVEIPYSDSMVAGCSGMRYYHEGNPIDFWIQSGCEIGGVVRTWVEIPSLLASTTETITVEYGDKTLSSASDYSAVRGTTPTTISTATNGGVATASSSYSSSFLPANVIDEDTSSEWAEGGSLPQWIKVTFDTTYSEKPIETINLVDRLNNTDNVESGYIEFADGDTINFGIIPDTDPAGTDINVPNRNSSINLIAYITGASASHAGFAEVRAITYFQTASTEPTVTVGGENLSKKIYISQFDTNTVRFYNNTGSSQDLRLQVLIDSASTASSLVFADDYIRDTDSSLNLQANNNSTNYLSLDMSTTNSSIYWEGVLSYTNDPGIRINGSTGELEYRDSDSATWTAFNSLGNLTEVYTKWDVDAPPITASAEDDEFNDGAIDVSWSEFDPSSTLTGSESNTLFNLTKDDTATDDLAGYYKSIPAGDFTYTTKVYLQDDVSSTSVGAGLLLYEDATVSTGDIYGYTLKRTETGTSVRVDYFTDSNTFSSSEYTPATEELFGSDYAYLRIRRSGTNLYFDISSNGISWKLLTEISAPAFTPTHIGPGLNNGGTDTGDLLNAKYDFFRYQNSDIGIDAITNGREITVYE